MTIRTTFIGGIAVAAAVVAGAIYSLQSFDAQSVQCEDIAAARAQLQATHTAGVDASVQVFAAERADAEDALHRCLSASPVDPCANEQKSRDKAVKGFNDISSPADSASYSEFQTYFAKRDVAYDAYKSAKAVLDACRSANPPKPDAPYEESDTKKCFDAYDASMASTQETFTKDTQALRTALNAAMAALDAREKACNPPTGGDQFTDKNIMLGGKDGATVPEDIMNCRPTNAEWDSEVMALRARVAAIPAEISAIDDSIENVRKRMGTVQQNLRDVETYIPPEAAKTQYEGVLNAKRAERKIALEASRDFYGDLLARRQAEKAALEQELKDVQAKLASRLAQIERENAARRRKYPTMVHLANPDECGYYHCHGVLCGRPDPKPDGCGHGTTTQDDVGCAKFMEAYLNAAGTK